MDGGHAQFGGDEPVQPDFREDRPSRGLGLVFAPGSGHAVQVQPFELTQSING
jgi:hypothetical protein